MRFDPPLCPYPACPSRARGCFRFARWGHYLRKCDGRSAQRFRCLECRRTFSAQAFRLDYRLHRPRLHLDLWSHLVSKTTHRQAARMLGCSRRAVAHRLELLGDHCRAFHFERLRRLAEGGGVDGAWQLDELETYEQDRRLQPLTVPVLIHRSSCFVVGVDVAPLPCRGGLSGKNRLRKAARERQFGLRRSGSRAAVERCLALLSSLTEGRVVRVETDRKQTYPAILRQVLGGSHRHVCTRSTVKRDRPNPLFPVNHTLAQLRDGVSRLVRRTWAASKRAMRLGWHLWIWICWRNYVRGVTNEAPLTTPAMILGAERRPLGKEELLGARVDDRDGSPTANAASFSAGPAQPCRRTRSKS
jgi:transposase-like protein